MYLAKKNIDTNLPIYVSLFRKLATGTNTEYKKEINSALLEAKAISCGEKEIFNARNDYFYLVSFLLTNAEEFLKNLDATKINNETYKKIGEILKKSELSKV